MSSRSRTPRSKTAAASEESTSPEEAQGEEDTQKEVKKEEERVLITTKQKKSSTTKENKKPEKHPGQEKISNRKQETTAAAAEAKDGVDIQRKTINDKGKKSTTADDAVVETPKDSPSSSETTPQLPVEDSSTRVVSDDKEEASALLFQQAPPKSQDQMTPSGSDSAPLRPDENNNDSMVVSEDKAATHHPSASSSQNQDNNDSIIMTESNPTTEEATTSKRQSPDEHDKSPTRDNEEVPPTSSADDESDTGDAGECQSDSESEESKNESQSEEESESVSGSDAKYETPVSIGRKVSSVLRKKNSLRIQPDSDSESEEEGDMEPAPPPSIPFGRNKKNSLMDGDSDSGDDADAPSKGSSLSQQKGNSLSIDDKNDVVPPPELRRSLSSEASSTHKRTGCGRGGTVVRSVPRRSFSSDETPEGGRGLAGGRMPGGRMPGGRMPGGRGGRGMPGRGGGLAAMRGAMSVRDFGGGRGRGAPGQGPGRGGLAQFKALSVRGFDGLARMASTRGFFFDEAEPDKIVYLGREIIVSDLFDDDWIQDALDEEAGLKKISNFAVGVKQSYSGDRDSDSGESFNNGSDSESEEEVDMEEEEDHKSKTTAKPRRVPKRTMSAERPPGKQGRSRTYSPPQSSPQSLMVLPRRRTLKRTQSATKVKLMRSKSRNDLYETFEKYVEAKKAAQAGSQFPSQLEDRQRVGQQVAYSRKKIELFQKFEYTSKDVQEVLIDDSDTFQRLKRVLIKKGAITNGVLQQRLHIFLKKARERQEKQKHSKEAEENDDADENNDDLRDSMYGRELVDSKDDDGNEVHLKQKAPQGSPRTSPRQGWSPNLSSELSTPIGELKPKCLDDIGRDKTTTLLDISAKKDIDASIQELKPRCLDDLGSKDEKKIILDIGSDDISIRELKPKCLDGDGRDKPMVLDLSLGDHSFCSTSNGMTASQQYSTDHSASTSAATNEQALELPPGSALGRIRRRSSKESPAMMTLSLEATDHFASTNGSSAKEQAVSTPEKAEAPLLVGWRH
jgi:hypothetical protein